MESSTKLLELLGSTLQVEHFMAGAYSSLAEACPDNQMKDLVLKLERDSAAHARVVQNVIVELGGISRGPQGVIRFEDDLEKSFRIQLEWERLALWCHRQASELAPDTNWKSMLRAVADAETSHIAMVQQIIARLAKGIPR